MAWTPRYGEMQVREAVEGASSIADALRRLGLRAAGGNFRLLAKLIEHYDISTEHLAAALSQPTLLSRSCGRRSKPPAGPRPELRKVTRPSYEQLVSDLESMSFLAVGRKYGVSDNAIRKWLRAYQRESGKDLI
jgi:hypothetical protein